MVLLRPLLTLTLVVGPSLALIGCDKPAPASSAPAKVVLPERDHWMIVPAGNPNVATVWRLNMKTGVLEFCYNDGSVKCGRPIPPQPTDAEIFNALTEDKKS